MSVRGWLIAICAIAFLAGCASVGPLSLTDEAANPTALTGSYGTGARVVGVLAFPEPNNLSGGDPNSVELAAKLAATTLEGNPLTVLVRPGSVTSPDFANSISSFEQLQASFVVGVNEEEAAVLVARTVTTRRVPTVSLTSFSDLAINLYAAGYVPNEEAVALVNEAARRGYQSLAVVSGTGQASENFAKAVLTLAATAGISARPVDGTTDSQFAASMGALASAGTSVSGVVFAVDPIRAASMLTLLKADARFASIPVIGNSGWSLSATLPPQLSGAWYTAPVSDGLAEFVKKFHAAYGTNPTLNGVVVYDLLVLAAALPKMLPDDPYAAEVMTNPAGFKGFSGAFRFGPTGMLSARTYTITTAK